MKVAITTLLLVVASTQSHAQVSSGGSYIIDVDDYPAGQLNATAWTLIYTYPLAIFANFAGSVLKNYSVNQIFHQRYLASANDAAVVKPNVDTLYSRVVLDLSHDDLILTVPEIEADRYWVYPVYDPFGQVVAEIGPANGNKAGRYLLRRADDVYAAPGFQNVSAHHQRPWEHHGDAFPLWDRPSGEHHHKHNHTLQGIVNLPGSYGTMLIRLLLIANTTSDLDAVHTIQNATSLTAIPRNRTIGDRAPYLSSTTSNGTFLGIKTPQQQFELAAKLVPHQQPIVYTDRYRVASILAQAGLYNGSYHATGVNLTHAAVIANKSITADITNPAHVQQLGNGHQVQTSAYQGYYGTHYGAAAYVALYGYQQLTNKQALYPGFQGPVFSAFHTLPQNGSWLFTFSGKPKLNKPGFWSLTVYGSDQYLIKNSLQRYEVGDRTYSISYEDGTPVYGPNATDSKDGPFQILLQDVNTPPPANWTGNWLPGDTSFYMLLRWYFPQPAMTNGSYVYMHVRNISAIVA